MPLSRREVVNASHLHLPVVQLLAMWTLWNQSAIGKCRVLENALRLVPSNFANLNLNIIPISDPFDQSIADINDPIRNINHLYVADCQNFGCALIDVKLLT